MKKTILLILLVIFSFCAFSTTQTSVVTVETVVAPISLSQAFINSDGSLGLYKLYGGTETENSSIDYILADDISENDITVYFKVDQLAKTRTDETIQLSVSANKLINTDAAFILSKDKDAKIETDNPKISVISCVSISALQVNSTPKNENEVLFTLRYLGYKPLENINIATFKTTWFKTTGLSPGLYSSDVILSYIMN